MKDFKLPYEDMLSDIDGCMSSDDEEDFRSSDCGTDEEDTSFCNSDEEDTDDSDSTDDSDDTDDSDCGENKGKWYSNYCESIQIIKNWYRHKFSLLFDLDQCKSKELIEIHKEYVLGLKLYILKLFKLHTTFQHYLEKNKYKLKESKLWKEKYNSIIINIQKSIIVHKTLYTHSKKIQEKSIVKIYRETDYVEWFNKLKSCVSKF